MYMASHESFVGGLKIDLRKKCLIVFLNDCFYEFFRDYFPLTPYLTKNLHNQEPSFIKEVMWSPRGNAIIFVYDNNIFYKRDVASTSEIYQITFTGSDLVYNGVPDWLYQRKYQSIKSKFDIFQVPSLIYIFVNTKIEVRICSNLIDILNIMAWSTGFFHVLQPIIQTYSLEVEFLSSP